MKYLIKHKFYTTIFLVIFFCFISCSKEKDAIINSSVGTGTSISTNTISKELSLSIVTGLSLHDDVGAPMGVLGNPNIKLPNNIQPYPNTPGQAIAIYSADTINKVWILPASADQQFSQVEYNTLYQTFNYTVVDIEKLDLIYLEPNTSGSFQLDLSSLNSGYYRLFFKTINDSLYWDNIYINTNLTYQEKVVSLVSFWQ
jgi:hypothetical protein